jgi:hypothetical protein
MAESSTQRKTSTHDAATLVQLEEQVARLSRRVEIDIARVKSPRKTLTGDEGQQQSSRQSSQRRNSGMVEELTRQVRQLTNSLAETDAAMEEQKRTSLQFRDKSVIFMLALSYADLISDLVLAVMLLRGAQAAYGVVSLAILGVSLVVQRPYGDGLAAHRYSWEHVFVVASSCVPVALLTAPRLHWSADHGADRRLLFTGGRIRYHCSACRAPR